MTILDLGALTGRTLLFGGPYSNFQATRAMQRIATELKIPPSNVICNGDVVAYCGQPEKTVETIRQWGIHTLMGNCEESVGEQQDDCGCGFEENTVCSLLSVEWYRFVSSAVSNSTRAWMRQLPRQIRFRLAGLQCAVIHGGVENMSEFVFLSSDSGKKHSDAASVDADCIIGGHCGIPFGQPVKNRYWLNTGVIGMPANDGTTDGWYLILEPQENADGSGIICASWHRLQFDHGKAAEAMTGAGLGSAYHDGLLTGLWPSMDILPDRERQACGQPLQLEQLEMIAPAPEMLPVDGEIQRESTTELATTAL